MILLRKRTRQESFQMMKLRILEDDVQKLTDKYIALIDKAIEEKTSEILTV